MILLKPWKKINVSDQSLQDLVKTAANKHGNIARQIAAQVAMIVFVTHHHCLILYICLLICTSVCNDISVQGDVMF